MDIFFFENGKYFNVTGGIFYFFENGRSCVGCDIVQADHAPEAGVAQGIFHGILVRHHGRNQEEVEEGLKQEVKRLEEDNTQEQVRMPMTMDGNEDTQTRLEPHVTVYA